MPAKSLCTDEIDDLIAAKINFEFAVHEKERHNMRQEHLPELGRDVQAARSSLGQCLRELTEKK